MRDTFCLLHIIFSLSQYGISQIFHLSPLYMSYVLKEMIDIKKELPFMEISETKKVEISFTFDLYLVPNLT